MSDNVFGKFAQLQSDLPVIKWDQENPHFKSKYASLEAVQSAILPLVAKAGFSVTFDWIEHQIIGTVRHGETEVTRGQYPMPEEATAQKMGSEITYAMRYLLKLLFNLKIQGEDDDGNAATETRYKTKPHGPKLASEKSKALLWKLMGETKNTVESVAEMLNRENLDDLTQPDCSKAIDWLKEEQRDVIQ